MAKNNKVEQKPSAAKISPAKNLREIESENDFLLAQQQLKVADEQQKQLAKTVKPQTSWQRNLQTRRSTLSSKLKIVPSKTTISLESKTVDVLMNTVNPHY